MKYSILSVFAFSALSCVTAPKQSAVAEPVAVKNPILVIGHRGAPGYRPEHTRASYELAIQMGADFIEPDLVMTKDRVLVARHENEISETTDVAEKFPQRKTTKTVDGVKMTGWFVEDFTLAEIKTLRARERLPSRDHQYDGQFEIPTFAEVIAIAKMGEQQTGRVIGIYPETKHPTYFKKIGLSLEEPLLAALKDAGWDQPGSPVFIQSFELSNLKKIRRSSKLPLIFLVDENTSRRPYDHVANGDKRTYGDLIKPAELKKMSAFVTGIGPSKRLIVPVAGDGRLGQATSLVADAHAAGLKVHPYTFRSDGAFLHGDYANPAAEYRQFCELGVDGLFSDFTADAVTGLRGCAGPR